MTKRLALVGAGAIARAFYLPALNRFRNQIDELWIVDPSGNTLTSALAVVDAKGAASLAHVQSDLDLVIVAAPNALHHQLASEALSRGSNVLVEKPFVSRPEDGEALIALASNSGKLVAVNQTRRYYPALEAIKVAMNTGELGALKSVEHFEGVKLDWPFESGAAFRPDAFRTGVIMDFAVHILDYYHALLQPEWSVISAVHDGFSGPEGVADIHVQAGSVPVHVRISRYHLLRNTALLAFEHGTIEFDVFDMNTIAITDKQGRKRLVTGPEPLPDYGAIADRLLRDVLDGIEQGREPRCTAAGSLPVIQMLDQIYRGATRFPETVGAI